MELLRACAIGCGRGGAHYHANEFADAPTASHRPPRPLGLANKTGYLNTFRAYAGR